MSVDLYADPQYRELQDAAENQEVDTVSQKSLSLVYFSGN